MDHSSEHHFEPGSIVMLKSGGPGLTVLGQVGDRVQCIFFSDEIGEFRETSLPAIALVAAEADEDEEDEDAKDPSEEDEDEDDRSGGRKPARR